MLCCSRGHSRNTQIKEEMILLENMTRFNKMELVELKTRFSNMTKGSNLLTKPQFRENMGVLGLGTMLHLSDRIFDVIDDNRDGQIVFQDFAVYFDKICNGDASEKAEISFKLIDRQRQGYFNCNDFMNSMHGIINSWTAMTGQHLNTDLKKTLDNRIKFIFDFMDSTKDDKITLERYQQCVVEDPNLLEIFDFINRGLKEFSDQQQNQDKQKLYLDQMQVLEKKLDDLIGFMKPEIKFESHHSPIKKKSSELSFIKIPHFQGDQDIIELPTLKKEIEQFHSPINSILQFKNQQQPLQFQDPSFNCNGDNDYEMKSVDNTFNAIKQVNEFSFQITQNKPKYFQHPLFQQVPAKTVNENCPETDEMNLSQISEQVSEENLDRGKEIEDLIINAPEQEIRKKYIDVLKYVKGINEDLRQLREKIGQEKLQKDKFQTQFKEQHLQMLRASTAMKVHNKFPDKVKQHKIKKPKISVTFGHANFNLVLNMMIGVQMAVNVIIYQQQSINLGDFYEITAKDFKVKYYFELLPRRKQSEKSSVKVCQFFDYAPQVFNSIRTIFGIDNQQYLKSIGPESLLQSLLKGDLSSLQELTSTGKSGSFFYYTADGQFTLKTVHKGEFKFLKEILKNYYQHIKKNSDTLIIKFFGMHKMGIKYSGLFREKIVYFVIMSNIFYNSKEIHVRYDLKGSSYKRITIENDPTVAKKDLNFLADNNKVKIDPLKRIQFLTQIEKDCEFFSQNNIIDYSLLLGIHIAKQKIDNESSVYSDQNYFDSLQVINSTDGSMTYYIGIIDILTNFSTKKKLEYVSKRIAYGPGISAIPPQDYSLRFQEFMRKSLFV